MSKGGSVRGLGLGFLLAMLLSLLSGAASRAAAEETLTLIPAEFTLDGPQAVQGLLVERLRDGVAIGPPAEEVVWSSSDPAVVEMVDGRAVPRGDGSAVITATWGDRQASAQAVVRGQTAAVEWSFRNHVQSVLTKTGCNMGACHGAALGKKGFRLTLRGYDSPTDYDYILRQARGRRVVLAEPAMSLLLLKPTGAVPHGGGLRFETGSPEYEVIAQWIAAGAPPPRDDDARIQRLELLPERSVLQAGQQRQMLVRAHFSDGRIEDVTRWAKYTSSDESVARVDEAGHVQVMGHGEGAVTAWYLSQVATSIVTVPYANAVDADTFAQAPRRNAIDEVVLAKLQSLNIPPSPRCSDAEFLRRAHLDTIGVLPTPDEARAFLADARPDKRDRLIESLLSRPEFVDYWSYKWSELLLVNSGKLRPTATWSFYNWVRNHVSADTPWDQMVSELLTARGSTLEQGAANFFVLHPDPQDAAETTTQAFLGLAIGCAKCHNHPLEKWTNTQYFGMANLFSRVRVKEGAGDGNKIVFDAAEGDVIQPITGTAPPPQPLDGDVVDDQSPAARRRHLALWLTSPENPFFARSIANRVWHNFLGVGVVEAVDDLRQTNPASNEELLSLLAGHLVENDFRLTSLMRLILQSETYQRSSQVLPENHSDQRFYSRFYPRRLSAEVLLDALSSAAGHPTAFPNYPAGWRALQLPDSNVDSYFLRSFGRPDRTITCECERSAEPSMVQVLHLTNGETINSKLEAKDNRIDRLLKEQVDDDRLVEEAYLACLSRLPTDDERARLTAALKETQSEVEDAAAARRQLVEDLFWALLSGKEFLFNH